MRTAALVAAVVMALLTAGCGATIKAEGAAKSVVDLVTKETGFRPTDVKCPDRVKAKVGTAFQCTFTGPEGTEYTADVRVTKVEGDDVAFFIQTHPS